MRRCLYIIVILLLFGCDSEVDIIHQSDPVPVVYCLLDPGRDIQTIRLGRTFITSPEHPEIDSVELLYYQSKIKLSIEKMDGDHAVDHTDFEPITVKKDKGKFPGEYHIVYQAKLSVERNSTYRLVIFIEEENKLIYSYTKTPGEFSILDPAYPEVRPLHFMRGQDPVFQWTAAENAAIYQLSFQLNYYESDTITTKLKTLMVPLNTMVNQGFPGQLFMFDINSVFFYKSLAELLEPSTTLTRVFQSLDAFVIAGGEELAIHYQAEISGDPFRIINYTNLQNSIGVFSSISYSYSRGFKITNQSIDSLAYGRFTKQLNFLDRDGHRKDK